MDPGKAMMVDRVSPTRLGSVLVPFQSSRGEKVVVEISRAQWQALVGEIEECWRMIEREAELGRLLLDIDREDEVV